MQTTTPSPPLPPVNKYANMPCSSRTIKAACNYAFNLSPGFQKQKKRIAEIIKNGDMWDAGMNMRK